MKLCAIQPPYPYEVKDADSTVEFIIDSLRKCDDSIDLILLPEYSNAPTSFPYGEAIPYAKAHTEALVNAVRETAIRCNAIVAANFAAEVNGKYRNTTRVFNRQGQEVGDYYKQQLTHGEIDVRLMDNSYVRSTNVPTIVEVDGLRLGFLICYDCYFNGFIENIALQKPDIVLISSMQRAEREDILEMQVRSIAFNCNAFVLRASLSMGADSTKGGNTMAAGPDGILLERFYQKTGLMCCEIGDPHRKYYRSNTFGGKQVLNGDFIENGRTPWAYRPAGAALIPTDEKLPYPRVCAHRGFSTVAPENSMPAFGAAIALGAQEIEFDVWKTTDGEYVLCHDAILDRISNGHGRVDSKSYEELLQLDFGIKIDPKFAGLKVIRLEEVLRKFQRQVIFNMHLKPEEDEEFCKTMILDIAAMLHKYDVAEHTYFMTGWPTMMAAALKWAPEIRRCMGEYEGKDKQNIVDNALKFKCHKLQFFLDHFDQAMIDRARANGLRCNYFYSDDPATAKEWLERGMDTILTNNYLPVASYLGAY